MLCCGLLVVYVVVVVIGVVVGVVVLVVELIVLEDKVFLVRENLVIQLDQYVSVTGRFLIAVADEALSAQWREQMRKICPPAQPLAIAGKDREPPVAQAAHCIV